jgi:hypothetical protein
MSDRKMNIFPAAISRVPLQEQSDYIYDIRKNFKVGNFNQESIYIFQQATYITDELTALDREIAVNTMGPQARAGTIDGIFVVAPNFENCDTLFNDYSDKLNISKQSKFILA